MMRGFRERLRERLDPQWLFYEGQKLRTRLVRLAEAIERLAGARPGPKLQVQFRGMEGLEDTVRRIGRRLALAMVAAASLVGSAFAAASTAAPGWMAPVMGIGGVVLTAGLLVDLFRRGGR
jgi:ubiquinone biosynthesis protein